MIRRRLKSARLTEYQPSWPFLTAILGSALMGLSAPLVRITDIGPNATGFYRVLFALPLLWVWKNFEDRQKPQNRPKITPKDYLLMILAGGSFALDMCTWHISIDMTTIINAALFNNFTPFFVPLIMWALFRERPTFIFMGSVIWVLLGGAILAGESLSLSFDHIQGDLLAVFSAFAFSWYIIVIKHLRLRFNAPTITFNTSIWLALFLLIFTLISGEKAMMTTWKDWVGVCGLALFVHVGAQGMLAYSMGFLPARLVALTMLMAPVVSGLSAWIFFGEQLNHWQLLGVLIVLSGIIMARQDERKHDTSLK